MSLTILALIKIGGDVALITLGDVRVMQQLQVKSVDTLASRLEKVEGGVMDPALVLSWAREGRREGRLIWSFS